MKKVLGLLLLVCSTSVYASDLEVNLGGLSYHLFDRETVYNEQNPAIGFTYKDVNVTVFKNSYHDTSAVVSKSFEWQANDWLSYSVKLGAVTGYDVYPVLPAVQFGATAWYKNHGLELGLFQFMALTLQYRYKF